MVEVKKWGVLASRFALCVASLLVLCSPTFAQSDTARLVGTVTDTGGAALPGATVTVTDLGTNRVVTAQADEDGAYTVPNLAPGPYRIEVTQAAFKTTRQDVTLEVQQVASIDFKLEPGGVTEVIEVTSGAPLVDSATSAIGEVIQGRQIIELPLNGRNVLELATLTPGVTRGSADSDASGARGNAETFRGGNTGGAVLSVNGLRPQANNYLLDGIDNNETLVNTISIFPQAEAVQEFRVQTSVAPAEFGRAGGAVVNSVIRSGTNEFSGSAFTFIRNDNLDARPTFNARKEEFRRGQFGGRFGGPIIRDRLFFFGDYQGLRQFLPLGRDLATVPTAEFRRGDFSVLLDPARSGLSAPIQLRDPLTGLPVPGNRLDLLPGNRLNPVGLAYLNAFPLPNNGTGVLQNFQNTRVQTQQEDTFDIRIDSSLSQSHQLFGRVSYGKSDLTTTSRLPTLPAGFGSGNNFNRNRGIAIGLTSVLTPNLFNELRVGAHRVFFGFEPPFQDQSISADLGIPGANADPLLGGGSLIGGFNTQLEYTGDFGPYLVPQNTYQVSDSLGYTNGDHTFRFGGGTFIRRDVNLFRPNRGKGYFFLFGNGENPNSTRFEQADLLIGFVNNYQVGPPFGTVGTRTYENALFAQDDWRVTPRLTLNFGLRYDVFTNPTEQYNRQTNFDLTTGQLLLAGSGGNSRALVDNDYNNFGPRVGFAYDLGEGRTVLRGGYGLFYFIDRGGIDNQLAQNPPFSGFSQFDFDQGFRITLSGRCPNNTRDSRLCTGPLPTGDVSGINLANPQNVTVFAILPDIRTSEVHQFNVQVQRQLTDDTAIDVGYVGTRGRKLATYYNINRQQFNRPAGTRLFPNLGDVNVRDDNGRSNYDSLQVQLERRFSRGLQFTAAYTLSKAKDNSCGAFDCRRPQDVFNIEGEYGNAALDIPHRFVASALYEIPFGRGRTYGSEIPRALDYVLGGWQLNGILNLQSGQVFDITASGGQPGSDVRVDLVGDPFQNVPAGRFFNPAAFANPPTNADGVFQRPGTLERNSLRGPSIKSLNLGLAKNFQITDRVRTQFRAEMFNVTNTPQFGTPNTDINNGTAFGTFQGTRLATNRQIQLGLRLEF